MATFTTQLDWRFATKTFDTTKKVSDADLMVIKQAIVKTPSSFGIQPYHIIDVQDTALRAELQKVSWGQSQVVDASHLFVFCARTDITSRIDQYVDVATGGSVDAKAAMQGYTDMMHGSLDNRSDAEKLDWAGRQAYIALGFAMAACAELSIDSCPMEGFDSVAVHKLLNLPENIRPLAFLPIGYRAAEPERPKVRFPESDLFSTQA